MGGAARAHAADGDAWFGRDKALHFSLSAAISAGGYGVASLATDDGRWRYLAGAAAGLGAGAGKESLDAAGLGDASWRDFTWDVIGTATGLALSGLIDWLWLRAPEPAHRAR
jgi:putative lipoprotein